MPDKENLEPVSTSQGRCSYLSQAWLVVLMAIVFGAALAAVSVLLGGVIATNKLKETLAQVPQLVTSPSGATANEASQAAFEITPGLFTKTTGERRVSYQLFRVDQEKRLKGWVVKASGQGYADKIALLIGFDAAKESITGLFVLEQKETPGLGNKIILPGWLSQFTGKRTEHPLRLRTSKEHEPDSIDAITGATISSRSVIDIINRSIKDTSGQWGPDAVRFSPKVP
jgi:electron transport complex protein RnfG